MNPAQYTGPSKTDKASHGQKNGARVVSRSGERLLRMQEARGSNPLISTTGEGIGYDALAFLYFILSIATTSGKENRHESITLIKALPDASLTKSL